MPLPLLLLVPPTIACGGYASWNLGYKLINSAEQKPPQTASSYAAGVVTLGASYLALAPRSTINLQKATTGSFAGRAGVAVVSFALAGATQAWLVNSTIVLPHTVDEVAVANVKALLQAHGLKPNHSLGQNFMASEKALQIMTESAAVSPGDLILEIGPGTGLLTERLLDAGAHVVAAEADGGMVKVLRDRWPRGTAEGDRLEIVHGDCLAGPGKSLSPGLRAALGASARPFSLVSNLPYQVASSVMASLLLHPEDFQRCRKQVVTVQLEVGQRLVASPRTKAYGQLGILAQAMTDGAVHLRAQLPPEVFFPPPKVTSAIVEICHHHISEHEHEHDDGHDRLVGVSAAAAAVRADASGFFQFLKHLFAKRRKQLGSIVRMNKKMARRTTTPRGLGGDRHKLRVLPPAWLDPTLRAEALPVDQLVELWRSNCRDDEGDDDEETRRQ